MISKLKVVCDFEYSTSPVTGILIKYIDEKNVFQAF